MDTTIATANALQRMLLQGFLRTRATRPSVSRGDASTGPWPDANDTLPMLYRSEAFAEDLLESHPAPG